MTHLPSINARERSYWSNICDVLNYKENGFAIFTPSGYSIVEKEPKETQNSECPPRVVNIENEIIYAEYNAQDLPDQYQIWTVQSAPCKPLGLFKDSDGKIKIYTEPHYKPTERLLKTLQSRHHKD